jgi:rhomboid protease GluP
MRQTTGSMICPHCGKLISVSEEECPFCGAKNPSFFGYAPAVSKLFGRRLDVIPLISTTCIVLYVVALILQPEAIFQSAGLFSILSPGTRALFQLGMTGGLAWQEGWWWTLFTAIFLHGGLLHIFFNVMWVRQLGPAVEEYYGPARTFVIFMISGAVGFLVSNLAPPGNPSVGASGSIFGLFAALIVYGRRTGSSMLTQQVWTWAIVLFAFGFFMSRVDNWAHAGGFAGGWVVATAMRFSHEKREMLPVQLLALGLLVVTAVGFVLSFWNVTSLLIRG